MKTKQCSHCGEHKHATTENFCKKSSTKDGLYGFCKPCKAEKDRAYRENNREKVLKKKKEHYRTNAERYKAERRQAYANDPQKFIDASREYKKKRKKTDPTYRLRERISNAVYCVLFRDAHTGKRSSTWAHLPYTPQQLREHIESQFDDSMTWDNYGSHWHIDHIYPQSRLPYDSMEHPNFLLCWSLDNLRPLSATENLKKSNKILDNHPQTHYITNTTTDNGDNA
jgi:hypothetical protein